jgi:hypothetical protein
MAVTGVALQCFGHEHNALSVRPCHSKLGAELIRPVRLTLSDAHHFGRVQRIDLWPALTLRLVRNHDRQVWKQTETFLASRITSDRAGLNWSPRIYCGGSGQPAGGPCWASEPTEGSMYLKIYLIRARNHRGEDPTGFVVASNVDEVEAICVATAT